MIKFNIDINADLGEGHKHDAAIMPFISSCNIACGGHYGDEGTMRDTIRLAKKYHVKTGAHPSFPDKKDFGRKVMTLAREDLKQSLIDQIKGFQQGCKIESVKMNHVKLHGALYNFAAMDVATAELIVEVMKENAPNTKLFVLDNSVLCKKAQDSIPVEREAFIDRKYSDDGTLLSREVDGSVLNVPEEAWDQLFNMVVNKEVITVSGKKLPLNASTYCIHGDHANSVEILKYIAFQMKNNNMALK